MSTRSSAKDVEEDGTPSKKLRLSGKKTPKPRGTAPGQLKACTLKGLAPEDCDFDRPIKEGWLRFKMLKKSGDIQRCNICYAEPSLEYYFTSGPELQNWLIEHNHQPYCEGTEYRKYFCMSTVPEASCVDCTLMVDNHADIERVMDEIKLLRDQTKEDLSYLTDPRYTIENAPPTTRIPQPPPSAPQSQTTRGGRGRPKAQMSDGGSTTEVEGDTTESDENSEEESPPPKKRQRRRRVVSSSEEEEEEEEEGEEGGIGGEDGEIDYTIPMREWGWYRYSRPRTGMDNHSDIYYWPAARDCGRTFINGPHAIKKYCDKHPGSNRGMPMHEFMKYFTFSRVIDVPGTLLWDDGIGDFLIPGSNKRAKLATGPPRKPPPPPPVESPPRKKPGPKPKSNYDGRFEAPKERLKPGPKPKQRPAVGLHGDTPYVPKGPDVSSGQDSRPMYCANRTGTGPDRPDPFTYVTTNVYADDVEPLPSGPSLVMCKCTDGCGVSSSCPCAQGIQHTDDPLTYEVFECHSECGCASNGCQNRILQKGPVVDLEIVFHPTKGWGVRTLGPILQGQFVFEMVGEVLPEARALQEVKSGTRSKTYVCEFYTPPPPTPPNTATSTIEPPPSAPNPTTPHATATNTQEQPIEMAHEQAKEGAGQPEVTVGEKTCNNANNADKFTSNNANSADTFTSNNANNADTFTSNNANNADAFATPTISTEANTTQPVATPVITRPALAGTGKAVKSKNRGPLPPFLGPSTPNGVSVDSPRPTPNRLQAADAAGANGNGLSEEGQRSANPCTTSYILDAGKSGNVARFVNYDCAPNLQLAGINSGRMHPRTTRLVFVARANIYPGTELTWDYGIPAGTELPFPLRCSCEGPCNNRATELLAA